MFRPLVTSSTELFPSSSVNVMLYGFNKKEKKIGYFKGEKKKPDKPKEQCKWEKSITYTKFKSKFAKILFPSLFVASHTSCRKLS